MNRFRGKAKGGIVGEPLPASQAAPPQDPGQRHLDVPPDDQPELPPPAVMHSKELFLGRSTVGTRLAIAHPLPSLHPPGVGLDFLLEIHDCRGTVLRWGACRDREIRTPSALSPQECCEATAARHKQGAGSYFRILGAGLQGGGLPRRRGRVSDILRQASLSRLR